jgi:hypothetical protein
MVFKYHSIHMIQYQNNQISFVFCSRILFLLKVNIIYMILIYLKSIILSFHFVFKKINK